EALLGRLPAAEIAVDLAHRDLGEGPGVPGRDLDIARPAVMAGYDLLRLRRVEEAQRGCGHGRGPPPRRIAVEHGHRGLSQDRDGRRDDLEPSFAELPLGEEGLIL